MRAIDSVLTALAILIAAAIIFIGARFLLAPGVAAAGFGVPVDPAGNIGAFLDAKGVRDIVSGLVVLALMLTRQKFALGLFLVVAALIPLGDMAIVLTHGGQASVAFGIHLSTAIMLVIVGFGIIWRTQRPYHA